MIEASPDSCPRCISSPAKGWILDSDGVWHQGGMPVLSKAVFWECDSHRNHNGVFIEGVECLARQHRQAQRMLEKASECMRQIAQSGASLDQQTVVDLEGMAAEVDDLLSYQQGVHRLDAERILAGDQPAQES